MSRVIRPRAGAPVRRERSGRVHAGQHGRRGPAGFRPGRERIQKDRSRRAEEIEVGSDVAPVSVDSQVIGPERGDREQDQVRPFRREPGGPPVQPPASTPQSNPADNHRTRPRRAARPPSRIILSPFLMARPLPCRLSSPFRSGARRRVPSGFGRESRPRAGTRRVAPAIPRSPPQPPLPCLRCRAQ